jgi:hypothetical protein
VTVTVVEAPAASVTVPAPLDAKTAELTSGTDETVNAAVCEEPETFVTRKTFVNVRAEGTRPKSTVSASTFPLATGVEVPGCTALPGVTEK